MKDCESIVTHRLPPIGFFTMWQEEEDICWENTQRYIRRRESIRARIANESKRQRLMEDDHEEESNKDNKKLVVDNIDVDSDDENKPVLKTN